MEKLKNLIPVALTVCLILIVFVAGVFLGQIMQNSSGSGQAVAPGTASSAYEEVPDDNTYPASSETLGGRQALFLREGDRFTFGNYKQGAYGEIRPIEWRVLSVSDGKALLISDKILDCLPYNRSDVGVSWENSTLRGWLNTDFLGEAFSSSEQSRIVTVNNQNPNNPKTNTYGGSSTSDKVFCLDCQQAQSYFSNSFDRMAAPTEYTINKGGYVSTTYSIGTGEHTGWWWLRTPGSASDQACMVDSAGAIRTGGLSVGRREGTVRPALWIYLD